MKVLGQFLVAGVLSQDQVKTENVFEDGICQDLTLVMHVPSMFENWTVPTFMKLSNFETWPFGDGERRVITPWSRIRFDNLSYLNPKTNKYLEFASEQPQNLGLWKGQLVEKVQKTDNTWRILLKDEFSEQLSKDVHYRVATGYTDWLIRDQVTVTLATPLNRNNFLNYTFLKFENAKLCDGGWNDRNKEPEVPEEPEEEIEPWTTEYLDFKLQQSHGLLNMGQLNTIGCICKGILDGQKPIGKLTEDLAIIDLPCQNYRSCIKCVGKQCGGYKINKLRNFCVDPTGTCKRQTCECDKAFAADLAKIRDQDPNYEMKYAWIENACPTDSLPSNGGSSSPFKKEEQCCKNPRDHFTVFNPRDKECCSDGRVLPLGTC